MSGAKSFLSMYMGTPLLDQLNDDLREAERFREAPRLSVPQEQVEILTGKIMRTRGTVFSLADVAKPLDPAHLEATLLDSALGTFRTESGRLAYFVVLPSLVAISSESKG